MLIITVGQIIREAKQIPSGHLFARLMECGMDPDTYTAIIDKLKDMGVIKEQFNMLTWIGPSEADDVRTLEEHVLSQQRN